MPKLKCDWDCCKHFNLETEYCDNPGEVILTTVEIKEVDEGGNETGEQAELFECESFVSYEEGEAK